MPERTEIGYFETRVPITIGREPEVGIAWQACCPDLGLCALGETPREATDSLLKFINKRKIVGRASVSIPEGLA